MRRALLSVYDKTGIAEFARSLVELGWSLYASSGTFRLLRGEGIEAEETAEIMGYPNLMGGRVKTLHPAIFGGILARRENPADMKEIDEFSIPLVDMIVCNLLPFEQAARERPPLDELIERIDIGGASMLRAGAKNYRHVVVVTEPGDYRMVTEELKAEGDVSLPTREHLAIKAFSATASYDGNVAFGLKEAIGFSDPDLPPIIPLGLRRRLLLRYGENPHQEAALYLPPLAELPWEQLSGRLLSYNNILDVDCAMRGCAMLQGDCGALVVQHASPCGMAIGRTPLEAYGRAHDCDPVSAYGGVVGISRRVDVETVRALVDRFVDVLVAPGYDDAALALISEKKPALRVLRWKGGRVLQYQITGTWSGFLVQEDALPPLPDIRRESAWIGRPRPDLEKDLLLAWRAAALSKSNAVAVVKDGASVGIGGGFCNRLHAVDFALRLAGDRSRGAVLGSDAFFHLPDAIELAADAGITAIIQPGGSIRDEEVFTAAEKRGLSMFISDRRKIGRAHV